jgi:DNA topoisomerase III
VINHEYFAASASQTIVVSLFVFPVVWTFPTLGLLFRRMPPEMSILSVRALCFPLTFLCTPLILLNFLRLFILGLASGSLVHRIGRTARAGNSGEAVAFLDGRSVGVASDLVDLLNGANQNVPAWLLGMSYVSRAKKLEEEAQIAAGAGGIIAVVENSLEKGSSSTGDDKYSGQDFRSSAAAGTWGSERDTSYHDFDKDAYSDLEPVSVDLHSSADDEHEDLSISDDDLSEDSYESDDYADYETEVPSATAPPAFERQLPSAELKRALGSATLEAPTLKTYSLLSRSNNQRLKFEYLGMFPFEDAAEILGSRNKKWQGNDQGRGDLPRVLMVAEKPSIATAIAEALSGLNGPRQRKGISRALPVYEFTSTSFGPVQNGKQNQPCIVTVTSVVGHVFSLGFIEEKDDSGRSFADPSEYFHMPIVKQEEESTGKLRVVDHLRALAGNCDHLVLWLDCDAEGENIAHEVIGVTRKALVQKDSQNSTSPIARIHRARFSAITKDALREAFSKLVEPDAALSRSVDARQELDLRVGVSITRLLNWRCVGIARKNFSPMTRVISYGPCQTPALSFCGDRAKEIEAFQPKEYWRVKVSCKDDGSKRAFELKWIPPSNGMVESFIKRSIGADGQTPTYQDSSTYNQAAASHIADLASKKSATLTIRRVLEIEEKRVAPVGLNTVALLSAGSKAMGMSPKQVMTVAEKLYSGGFISYPRTETTRYDKTFDVRTVLREHIAHPEWGKTAAYVLKTKYPYSGRPPNRGRDSGDHPPITCLRASSREEVGGGVAWRVYEFICRTFIGSLSDDMEYTRRVAELEISGINGASNNKFQLEQVTVDKLGFAGSCSWVLNDIGAPRPDEQEVALREGMMFRVSNSQIEKCSTKPPRFLQEHELIELMDKNRIGTDASMASHVSSIMDRGYVVLCDETGTPLRPPRPPRPGQHRPPRQIGRYLVPTPLGLGLLALFHERFGSVNGDTDDLLASLSRPAIRAQMEAEVKQIAVGQMDKDQCLSTNLAWFEKRYHELANSLTRQRLDDFARCLSPTSEALKYWRKLGVFEPAAVPQKTQSSKRKGGWQNNQKGGKSANRRGGSGAGTNRKDYQRHNKTNKAIRPDRTL